MLQTWLAATGFVLLAIAGPGVAWQRLFRVAVDPALVLPLGAAHTAAFYWLALVAGHPGLFPMATLLLDAALLIFILRPPFRWAAGPTLRGAVPPFAAIVGFLALTA